MISLDPDILKIIIKRWKFLEKEKTNLLKICRHHCKGEYPARILKMEIKLVVNHEIMENEERDFPFALERCLKTGTL